MSIITRDVSVAITISSEETCDFHCRFLCLEHKDIMCILFNDFLKNKKNSYKVYRCEKCLNKFK